MTSLLSLLQTLSTGALKYAPVITAVTTGIGSIVAKNYSVGAQEILQALTLLFAGASAAQLHYAIHRVPAAVLRCARDEQ